MVKFKGINYKNVTLSPDGRKFRGKRVVTIVHPREMQRFSGKQVVSKSRPVEAADYETSFRKKGSNFDDGSGRHRTDRVWSVYNIPRKPKGSQKVRRNSSPFQATRDGRRKRCSPKAAGVLVSSLYENDEYETAKSS